MTEEQLGFDLEGMLHEAAVAAAPEWHGAPLHFTTAYYSPYELDAAVAHWQFLHRVDGSRRDSRMWHRAIAVPGGVEVGEQGFDLFTVDLRCDPWKHPAPHAGCACIGDLTYMAICEPHAWRAIASDENAAVEGWHDHAFPVGATYPSSQLVSETSARSDSRRQPGSGSSSGTPRRCRSWVRQSSPSGAASVPDMSLAAHPGVATTSQTLRSIRAPSATGGDAATSA